MIIDIPIYYVPNVLKNIKFSWNLFQNRINQICTLQKRVHEWVQSFSVWKSANRGVKIRFHMPQKVTFCIKTLHDISWINSARLENHLDPILELLYNFHDLKKRCCRFFVLLHSICLTWSDNYSFFAIFECTNVKLLQILIFATLRVKCNLDLATLLVVTKLHNVTKSNDFM